jgi:glycosyltransferase involved in cell wall biosynthesis
MRTLGPDNSQPLVSVIVIFLNAEKFIVEAIQSILGQTYDNWELLLVDDGSTDASTQIALGYAERYPGKVRYLKHPGHQNRGMSASRNLGISHAKGEYTAFLDADDKWFAYKLEQQVAILSSHPEAGMVYGRTLYWRSWTGDPADIHRDSVPDLGIQVNKLFEPPTLLTLLYPLGSATPPSLSNLLLRRGAVERAGGFEEDFRGMYEDQAFLSKTYLTESVFVASESECWDKYRQHSDSCFGVTERAGQHQSARLFFLNWLEQHLSERGVENAEIWKLLSEEQLIAGMRAHVQKREGKQVMRDLLVLLRHHPQAFARYYRKVKLRAQLRR